MHLHRLLSKHNIAVALLIAIMIRASVATGWMVEIPTGNGFALPVLAICPQQSPGVAAWLDQGPVGHAHHQHSDPGPQSDISLTVADPACALWAGSALASANGIAAPLRLAPRSAAPAIRHEAAPRHAIPSRHRARGPPVLQSV